MTTLRRPRSAHRRGAALLAASTRASSACCRKAWCIRVLAHRSARALRAGASRADDRERARRRSRSRPRLSQPHSAPLRRGRVCSQEVRAANDGRQSLISITAKGRKAFAPLNKGSHDQVAEMLGRLTPRRAGARRRRDGNGRSPCSRSSPRPKSRSSCCCATIAPATWAGSPRRTARSTRRNTAGTSRSRRWWRRSPRSSSRTSIQARALLDRRNGRRARRLGVRGAARPTSREAAPADRRSQGARAGTRQAAWSTNACASRKSAGYTSMTLWTQSILTRRAASTSARDSSWSPRSRTIRSASISISETWERDL